MATTVYPVVVCDHMESNNTYEPMEFRVGYNRAQAEDFKTDYFAEARPDMIFKVVILEVSGPFEGMSAEEILDFLQMDENIWSLNYPIIQTVHFPTQKEG